MGRKKAAPKQDKTEKPVESTLTHSLFIHKKDRGVTVMTKEASMMADETTKNRKPQASSRHKDCIHKIRED